MALEQVMGDEPISHCLVVGIRPLSADAAFRECSISRTSRASARVDRLFRFRESTIDLAAV
jgi:hypothetical protein